MGTSTSIINKPISSKIAHRSFRTKVVLWWRIYSDRSNSININPPRELYFGLEPGEHVKLEIGTILTVYDVRAVTNCENGDRTEVLVGFTDPRRTDQSNRSKIIVIDMKYRPQTVKKRLSDDIGSLFWTDEEYIFHDTEILTDSFEPSPPLEVEAEDAEDELPVD